MPNTLEEHVIYTRDEFRDWYYYPKMISVLKNEDIKYYLDIGANCGEFRNIIIENIPSIIASFLIEPEPNNFEFLQNHVSNKDECVFFNVAIGYSDSDFCDMVLSSNVGGHQITSNKSGTIPLKKLEDLGIPVVDLVKMDVEGLEFDILKNSEYLKKVKWMDIEFHQTPEQESTGFVKDFIEKNLENFDIVVHENTYGRCLLKNKL